MPAGVPGATARTFSIAPAVRSEWTSSLARLLPAEPLILDEPRNNLDLAGVEQLAETLDAYRGALLIISRDVAFLEQIGVDTIIELNGTDGCASTETWAADSVRSPTRPSTARTSHSPPSPRTSTSARPGC